MHAFQHFAQAPCTSARHQCVLATCPHLLHQPAMPIAKLSQRAVLAISGADARAFLQGQITNDIDQLTPCAPLYAGLLSPQGKCLFAFILFAVDGDSILLDCAATQAESLAKRLSMFKLRRAVSIAPTPLAVFASWGERSSHPADPRSPAAGARWVAAAEPVTATLEDWHAHRLPLALPEADELGSDDLLWLETNARDLNGVSFTKGCYVGQENTARMHHRGKVRKALLAVQLSAVATSTTLRAGDKDAGSLRGTPHGALQMALVRTEYLDQPLSIDGAPAPIIRPEWLTA